MHSIKACDFGVLIDYIQPGKLNQNAYIERFNRTFREEVLNMSLFRDLDEVRQVTSQWRTQYNEVRPHDALGGAPPSVYATQIAGNSTLKNCLLDGRLTDGRLPVCVVINGASVCVTVRDSAALHEHLRTDPGLRIRAVDRA